MDPPLKTIPSLRTFPLGVFLVEILIVLEGIRTGPSTVRFFSFAPLTQSAHTFSKDFMSQAGYSHSNSMSLTTSGRMAVFPVSLKAMASTRLPERLVPQRGQQWSQEQSG